MEIYIVQMVELYTLEKLEIFPLEIWGDLDSVSEEILEKYSINNVIIKRFPKDKDFTDGELVLQHLMDKGYDEIRIIGGLGGRIDHALTNLNLIFKFKNTIFLTEKEKIFLNRKGEKNRRSKGKNYIIRSIFRKSRGFNTKRF